jgi:hypothetical protein
MENITPPNNLRDDQVEGIYQATFRYLFSHPVYYIFIITIIVIGTALTLVTHLPQFVVFSLVLSLLIFIILTNKMRALLMKQFALNLGYTYAEEGDLLSVSGSFFSIGHSQTMKYVIGGKDDNRPVRVFLYSYTVGSGKNSHTYRYTVFESTFNGNMPHMLLDSKKLFFSNDIPDFSGGHHISLEGDFDKYFSLYVEKEFEIEALQMFDPDFMAELIESSKSFSAEFFQNKIYVFLPKLISTKVELDMMFSVSNKLCNHLVPVVNSIKGDVDALRDLINK